MVGEKSGELNKIAEVLGVDIDEILMIGDGGSDYNGAKNSGSQFVGIVADPDSDKWSEESFPKTTAVSKVPSLLNL